MSTVSLMSNLCTLEDILTFKENDQLIEWANRIIRKEEKLPERFTLLRKGATPYFVTGVQVLKQGFRYPAMNICVEYKKFLSQLPDLEEAYVGYLFV
jgi:hypothetical protein